MVKKVSKVENPERLLRSVSNFDEAVIDCECDGTCVKVANVKSVKKCSAGEHSQTPTRTPRMF